MTKRVPLVLVLLSVLLLGATGHAASSAAGARAVRFLMGTWCELVVLAPAPDEVAAEAAFQEIARLDKVLSNWDRDSELSRLNRASGHGFRPVSSDLVTVVGEARSLCTQSGGAFDPTVAPLVEAWGFLSDTPGKPRPEIARQAASHVGCDRAAVEYDPPDVKLADEAALDLGGIGKGYAVDRALAVLESHGVTRARVDFGSSSLGFLGRIDGGWPVVIADPRDRTRPLLSFRIEQGAVSSSGQHERSFVQGGHRYGHIFDPRTGVPVESRLLLVTAIAPRGSTADGLSTAFFVMGPERGGRLAASLDGVGAIFVEEGSRGLVVTAAGSTPEVTLLSSH